MKFYGHIIEIQTVVATLDELELSREEKLELAELLDATIHHRVLDVVMSELDEKDKEAFMRVLSKGAFSEIWEFLDRRTLNIEDRIKISVEELKIEMFEDIKAAKEEKKK